MLEQIKERTEEIYKANNQWLELESQYEATIDMSDQTICLIDKKINRCVFCVNIRTYNALDVDELGWQPFLKFDPIDNIFAITIPKFKPLTSKDIALAIRYIIRENFFLIFNVRIDGKNIAEEINYEDIGRPYKMDRYDLRRLK